MAKEITLSLFERNAKVRNKKGLRRSFSSIPSRYTEYINMPPLGATSKFVIEATVDKEYADEFVSLLKEKGFDVLGSMNYYFLDKIVADYDKNKNLFVAQKEAIEAISKDLVLIKENYKPYEELENDDVKFYFTPYVEGVDTLFEFIGVYKDQILEFAKEKDITIMLRPVSYCNQLDGFFGFNFFDAESEEEIVVDYASALNIIVDFKNSHSVYAAGLLLTGIGENEDELKVMNVRYLGDNLVYEKE